MKAARSGQVQAVRELITMDKTRLLIALAQCRASQFAFIVLFILVPLIARSPNAAEPIRPTPTSGSTQSTDTYDVLRERIRATPVLDPSDPKFPDFLIGGSRYGGRLLFSPIVPDPMNPNTVDANFDTWNLASRASLLLQYARLVTGADTPTVYVGVSDDDGRTLRAHEADERARISQLAHVGKYEADWRSFVDAYRKFSEAAEKATAALDTQDGNTEEVDRAIGRLARELEIYRLVRNIRIEPTDVANEMLRSLKQLRASMDTSSGGSEPGADVVYTCESEPILTEPSRGRSAASRHRPQSSKVVLNVRVHTWHSLAPAFFRAWDAVEKKSGDPQAGLIVRTFLGLSDDINSWAFAHPHADTSERDRQLRQMAVSRGLISLLASYGDREANSQSTSPGDTLPAAKPNFKEEEQP